MRYKQNDSVYTYVGGNAETRLSNKSNNMKNEIAFERGINIIWNYVRNDYSWKDSYFKHFTKGQKFLFFLPVIFLFLPVYGTYELFYNHSWTSYILLGLGMLFSIWWFHKQKAYF